jgi:hypothetical protein
MRQEIILIGGLVTLLLAATTAAEPPDWVGKARPEIRQHRIQGGGSWRGRGRKPRLRQRWSLDVARDDAGRIQGNLVVGDSPLLKTGRVEGVIHGRRVTGAIAGERGESIAKFYGIITDDGVRGTYVDRTGETGEWTWEGPVPE